VNEFHPPSALASGGFRIVFDTLVKIGSVVLTLCVAANRSFLLLSPLIYLFILKSRAAMF